MKTYRLTRKGTKVGIQLESDRPRYDALDDIVLTITDYLLGLGRVDQVLMLALAISLRCKAADTCRSKFTPEQRASAMGQIDQLLGDAKGGG